VRGVGNVSILCILLRITDLGSPVTDAPISGTFSSGIPKPEPVTRGTSIPTEIVTKEGPATELATPETPTTKHVTRQVSKPFENVTTEMPTISKFSEHMSKFDFSAVQNSLQSTVSLLVIPMALK
jgi:hypothetical protein